MRDLLYCHDHKSRLVCLCLHRITTYCGIDLCSTGIPTYCGIDLCSAQVQEYPSLFPATTNKLRGRLCYFFIGHIQGTYKLKLEGLSNLSLCLGADSDISI